MAQNCRGKINQVRLGLKVFGRPGGCEKSPTEVKKFTRTRWCLVLQNAGVSQCHLGRFHHLYHKLRAPHPCTQPQDTLVKVAGVLGSLQMPQHGHL